jgi:hypothetical protein
MNADLIVKRNTRTSKGEAAENRYPFEVEPVFPAGV